MGKMISTLLILLTVAIIAVSTFFVLSFLTMIMSSVVNFASSYESTKLYACGINAPPEFYQLKNDAPTFLPILYLGFPILLILIAVISYIAGTHHGSSENESLHKHDEKVREKMREEDEPDEEEETEEEEEEEADGHKVRTARRARTTRTRR